MPTGTDESLHQLKPQCGMTGCFVRRVGRYSVHAAVICLMAGNRNIWRVIDLPRSTGSRWAVYCQICISGVKGVGGSSGMLKEVPLTASAVGTIRICQLAATKMVE